jgi:aminoglycoside phosphotransferase (APT) family kinase protein
MSVGWLPDGSEESLRYALEVCAPELADLPLRINPWHAASNPLWWSSSAVIDDRFVVKFAWSEIRAGRLWREGMVLERLRSQEPLLALPELVVLSREPALVVTRRVEGESLGWEWVSSLGDEEMTEVARELATFLVQLHGVPPGAVIGDLPVISPTAQADTETLRRRFISLVDENRGQSVLRWCEWVDDVFDSRRTPLPEVLVHGDLHGYNQVWDRASASLLVVVDFEESGIADPHFDLRYIPGNFDGPELVLAIMAVYEQLSGRRLSVERVMAWHVLTALGDAMWRTEAGVALPDGGTATTYVDRLSVELGALELD